MSTTKEFFTTVLCDICGNWERFSTSRNDIARAQARKAGWTGSGKIDFCPECSKKMREKGKAEG